jgi:Putative Ig domain
LQLESRDHHHEHGARSDARSSIDLWLARWRGHNVIALSSVGSRTRVCDDSSDAFAWLTAKVKAMKNNIHFRIRSRWPLVLMMSAALAGCFDEKSNDAGSSVVGGATGGSTPTVSAPATTTNRAPEISGIPSATGRVGVAYSFTPVATDEDDDFLEFEITNKPAWAQFSVETGALTGTPAAAHVGVSDEITITVTDGREQRVIGPFRITIASATSTPPASNTPPTITGTPATTADAGVAYNFAPAALDADGNRLTYSISNRPAWMTFNTSTGQLRGTPAAGNVGTYSNIIISVNDGHATTLLPAFAIQVRGPANQPPRITGTPSSAVQATQQYSFQPVGSDPDGDTLTFSITNRPTWATFTASTGRLSGTPTSAGTYSNIVVRVSDGRATASLPAFSISVTAPPAQPVPTQPNRAPTVSGSPSTSAQVGTAYAFQPAASDADGDALAWTIENRPSWLSFNTATGRLSGTPTSASVASNIIIRVSDGTATASLAPFSIAASAAPAPPPPSTGNATLSWQAPTQNTDGTAITNLAGYRVIYGTSQSAMNQSVTISNPGTTIYVVEGLTAATWYFAVKAFTSTGAESSNSGIASKTIQ